MKPKAVEVVFFQHIADEATDASYLGQLLVYIILTI